MVRAKKQPRVAETVQPPRVGAVSNLFRGDPAQVAEIFQSYGLQSVLIQPNLGPLKVASTADLRPKMCRELSLPFIQSGVAVAGVISHVNWVDPDPSRRRRLIKRFDAFLDRCRDFGARHVVTESGTLDPEHPWSEFAENRSPQAFAMLKRSLAPSVRLAEQNGVKILLKGYLYHVVYSFDVARALHEHFGDRVGFVMDPANYFTRNMVSASTTFVRKMFEAIGAISPIAAAKDVRYVGGVLTTPRAGTGSLDYKEFLELLDEYQPDCPMILEQIRPEELRETLDFLDRFFE